MKRYKWTREQAIILLDKLIAENNKEKDKSLYSEGRGDAYAFLKDILQEEI